MGGPRSFSIAALVDAILLMLTTGVAFAFILSGRVQQHRQWMTRSFAVALVFLEVRVVLGITGWEKLGVAATETVVWACLAVPYWRRTSFCSCRNSGVGTPSPPERPLRINAQENPHPCC